MLGLVYLAVRMNFVCDELCLYLVLFKYDVTLRDRYYAELAIFRQIRIITILKDAHQA